MVVNEETQMGMLLISIGNATNISFFFEDVMGSKITSGNKLFLRLPS